MHFRFPVDLPDKSEPKTQGLSKVIVISAAVGGAVTIIVLIVVVIFCVRRHRL